MKEKDQHINNNQGNWFKRFFINYFWVGLLVLMTSIVLDSYYPSHCLMFDVLIKTLEGIGVSVLIASIFTYASSTSEFMEMIRKLLQDIVVDRNFLGNIDSTAKRRALASLIKPSDIERRIYSNLEDYYDVFINKTLDISKKCVRSGYNVRARIFIENDRAVISQDISYRMHPTKDGYDNIVIRFEDIGFETARCDYIIISAPDGTRTMVKSHDLKWESVTESTVPGKTTEIDLRILGANHAHLNIELRLVETGLDHWIHVAWQSLQPTDGFTYSIRCEDGLKIKSFLTFVHGAIFHAEKHNDRELMITCHEWFNEGAGICLVASRGSEEPQEKSSPTKAIVDGVGGRGGRQ